MQVKQTSILDQNGIDNTNASKVFVMNNIVDHFVPLFHEEIDRKQKQYDRNAADVAKLKAEVGAMAQNLKQLDSKLKYQTEAEVILDRIKYLADYDVLYGNNRRIALDAVQSIHTGDISKLKAFSGKLEKLIFKNIKKVIT
jgi:hypothetical protein